MTRNGWLSEFLRRNRLPGEFVRTVDEYYRPLADWAAARQSERGSLVLGINGGQGSGKSTLANFLSEDLCNRHGLKSAVLSIDDIYLTRTERQRLSREIHPMLATRGVPGTHDVALGARLLDDLVVLPQGVDLAIPRFDKLTDDRRPEVEWDRVEGPLDIVLFEGWCVGTPPQAEPELLEPENEIEAQQDAGSEWRRYVNRQLETTYADLFGRLGGLVFLQVPDLDAVRRWRHRQEQGLAARSPGAAMMSSEEIRNFVAYFERLTRHNLRVLPHLADVVLGLDPDHGISSASYRSGPG